MLVLQQELESKISENGLLFFCCFCTFVFCFTPRAFAAMLHTTVGDLKTQLKTSETQHEAALSALRQSTASELAAANTEAIASAAAAAAKIDSLTERITELTARYDLFAAKRRALFGIEFICSGSVVFETNSRNEHLANEIATATATPALIPSPATTSDILIPTSLFATTTTTTSSPPSLAVAAAPVVTSTSSVSPALLLSNTLESNFFTKLAWSTTDASTGSGNMLDDHHDSNNTETNRIAMQNFVRLTQRLLPPRRHRRTLLLNGALHALRSAVGASLSSRKRLVFRLILLFDHLCFFR
jgi:hypothetical protein